MRPFRRSQLEEAWKNEQFKRTRKTAALDSSSDVEKEIDQVVELYRNMGITERKIVKVKRTNWQQEQREQKEKEELKKQIAQPDLFGKVQRHARYKSDAYKKNQEKWVMVEAESKGEELTRKFYGRHLSPY